MELVIHGSLARSLATVEKGVARAGCDKSLQRFSIAAPGSPDFKKRFGTCCPYPEFELEKGVTKG